MAGMAGEMGTWGENPQNDVPGTEWDRNNEKM